MSRLYVSLVNINIHKLRANVLSRAKNAFVNAFAVRTLAPVLA